MTVPTSTSATQLRPNTRITFRVLVRIASSMVQFSRILREFLLYEVVRSCMKLYFRRVNSTTQFINFAVKGQRFRAHTIARHARPLTDLSVTKSVSCKRAIAPLRGERSIPWLKQFA